MTADSPYTVVTNPVVAIPTCFQTYLFNEPFHINKQPCEEKYTFYLLHQKTKQAHARFTLFVEETKGFSPCRGPFGSIEFNSQLPVQHLDAFVEYINAFAREIGLQQLAIKSYPFCYQPESSALLSAALLRQKYQLLYTDINYHLPVTQKEFTNGLHLSEKRRLQKCIEKGLVFIEEADPDLPLIYKLIVDSRTRKGYPVSMSFDDFSQLFDDFPGIYKVFTVRDKQTIAAMTVGVYINQKILYYFLPAHLAAYDAYSPMVLLMQGLYIYCQNNHVELLDLGISTDKSVPNYGLMRFKQNLGASVSLKLSFVKDLEQE
jgi:hypothetical protein